MCTITLYSRSTLGRSNATVVVMQTPDTNLAGPSRWPTDNQDAGTPLGLAALLAGTLVGTVSNNVVNIPLAAILDDFDAPLGSGVFVVVGFLVAFAATDAAGGMVRRSVRSAPHVLRRLARPPRYAPSAPPPRRRCRC